MNRFLVLLLASTLALSGCFGYPEGSATPGSAVTARVVALDADSGEPLVWSLSSATIDGTISGSVLQQALVGTIGEVPASMESLVAMPLVSAADVASALEDEGLLYRFGTTVNFVAGSGGSGMGIDFENGVLGTAAGANATFVSRDDPSLSNARTVTTPAFLGSSPASGEVDLATFETQIGPAVVNQTFEFNAIYQAIVVSIVNDTVTYRFHIEGERQEDPADVVGATLVSYVDGDDLVRELEPVVGATFTIQPPTQFQPSPLGLEPGSYTTVGLEDGELVYEVVTVRFPELVGHDVEYRVHVVDVATAATAEMEDDYGVRQSPVVRGDPTSVDDHGHVHGVDDAHDDADDRADAAADDHADSGDGHTH